MWNLLVCARNVALENSKIAANVMHVSHVATIRSVQKRGVTAVKCVRQGPTQLIRPMLCANSVLYVMGRSQYGRAKMASFACQQPGLICVMNKRTAIASAIAHLQAEVFPTISFLHCMQLMDAMIPHAFNQLPLLKSWLPKSVCTAAKMV